MNGEDRGPKTEDRGPTAEAASHQRENGCVQGETCDHCGAEALSWRKCKLVCGACGNIVKSCADL